MEEVGRARPSRRPPNFAPNSVRHFAPTRLDGARAPGLISPGGGSSFADQLESRRAGPSPDDGLCSQMCALSSGASGGGSHRDNGSRSERVQPADGVAARPAVHGLAADPVAFLCSLTRMGRSGGRPGRCCQRLTGTLQLRCCGTRRSTSSAQPSLAARRLRRSLAARQASALPVRARVAHW